MNFASDNVWGAAPEMIEALRAANSGAAPSYGEDALTARLATVMDHLFERRVAAFPVISGTAANALALATIVPLQGAVFCHAAAHIVTDECGAPEFFTHGAKVVPLDGPEGKIGVRILEAAINRFVKGSVHHPQPAAVSITQATECGTCYEPPAIAAIADLAHRNGMRLHMDGSRLANAIAHLSCTPAEATWKAGVDVLSFGATKNCALGAESVVFFNPPDADDFEFRRKKAGHLLSKMRFMSAQLLCALEQDRWLAWASRANALARRLAEELEKLPSVEIGYPVEANSVFVFLPNATVARLRGRGAQFYDWGEPDNERTLVRLVTSHGTPESDIEQFLAAARP
ncbi:MAG TPA: beta-eliminating lyase-related protein [Rhizomicrobium sp.]|jgi:threonine aldolase